MGKVVAVCVSRSKGERKHPVDSATFRQDHGIESDAHAGPWHRQVSLLAEADIEGVRRAGLSDLVPGCFAENVVLAGLDLASFGLGTCLRLGPDVALTITQIGKVCHTPCRIYHLTGDCIMPRLGLFARVTAGGRVQAGDAADVLKWVSRDTLQAVVLTLSDRCARGAAQDTAGPAVAQRLEAALGANIYATEILPDERELIAERMRAYAERRGIDLVVAVGGTGFSPRDVTPEATRQVVERLTPGLDEAMRAASLSKTPHAALSRGVSGIRGGTLILNLPGSERAAVENLEAILPALRHGLMKLRGDPADCGRPPHAEGSHAG